MSLLQKVLEKINVSADVQATIKKDMTEEEVSAFLLAFEEDHAKTWLTEPDAIKSDNVRGSILKGKLTSLDKIMLDEHGLTADEVKDKKTDEIIKIVASKHKSEIDGLKEQIGADSEEVLKKANSKIEELTQSLTSKTDLLTGAQQAIDEGKTEMETFKNGIRLNGLISKERNGIKLINGEHAEMAESHFNSKVAEMLKFKEDEQGQLIVTDAQGNQIKSKVNAAKFLSPFEAMDNLAAELKVKRMADPNPT